VNWFRHPDDPDRAYPYDSVDQNPMSGLNVTMSTGQDKNGIPTLISTLEISNSGYGHRAYFVCEANNGIATARVNILVRVKDKLAALWPFLGIVGEVIILCTVIFIYEKRRSKDEFAEPVNENAAAGKSPNTSPKGQDVRQRK